MEKQGKVSRIGDANRAIEQDNSAIAQSYRQDAMAERPAPLVLSSDQRIGPLRPTFNRYSGEEKDRHRKAFEQRAYEARLAVDDKERHHLLDLDRKHQPERISLEADQAKRNAVLKATMLAEIDAIDRRARATGVTRFFHAIIGQTRRDAAERELYAKTLEGIERREKDERDTLAAGHARQRVAVMARYTAIRAKLTRAVDTNMERRRNAAKDMADERDKENRDRRNLPKGAEKERPPPKPEPSLQPAPPRGAGPTLTPPSPSDRDTYERKVRSWAETPEGRAVWQKGAPESVRAEFEKQHPEPKAPEETPSRTRDAWKKATRDKSKDRDPEPER